MWLAKANAIVDDQLFGWDKVVHLNHYSITKDVPEIQLNNLPMAFCLLIMLSFLLAHSLIYTYKAQSVRNVLLFFQNLLKL